MASMFRRNPRTKITSLFREVFFETASAHPDEPVFVAITVAAEACGMKDYDAEGIAERLAEMAQKAAKRADEAKNEAAHAPAGSGSGYGAKYTKWLGGLSQDQLCLWLADFDFDKAKKLYSDTDIDDLSVMVQIKSGHEWEQLRTRFEACVLGFGGKLENQSEGIVHKPDMNDTKSVNDMIDMVKAMGF